jgi:hypothetical protein
MLVPRMRSVWPLLLCVLLSTLIAASLVATFASFSASALPQAVSAELLSSGHRSIVVNGAINGTQNRTDQAVVAASIRRAFGATPYSSAGALWSDSISLPARPGSKTVPLVQAASMSGVRTEVSLLKGSWPTASPVAGAPLPVVVPQVAVTALRLSLGQVLTLRDLVSGTKVSFVVAGVYQPRNQAATYWGLDQLPAAGVGVEPGFITYGPLLVSPAVFSSGRLAIGGASWLYQLGTTKITATQLSPLSTRLDHAIGYLTTDQNLGGLNITTGLPALLSGVATKLVVARSLLLVSELELLLLSGAALTLTARTLATQREEESATFSARGAGRRQLLGLALTEALLVTAVAAVAGAVLGSRLARLLARSGPLRTVGLHVTGIPAGAWITVAIVLALCTAVMIWPALRRVNPNQARARKGRQAAIATAVTAGADVGLIVLAVLAAWQLRRYSVLGQAANGLGVDPVLALAPAIALAAGTVLPLRLLPMLARAGDRFAARTRRLGGALTSWELARRATRQSAPMLLVVLAVGTSTLALAQHDSWRQSGLDQSAFLAGADVRATTLRPATPAVAARITRASGVTAAMAVSPSLTPPVSGEVLAVDARQGAGTVLLRPGEAPAGVWRQLIPPAARHFITLPGRPARIGLTASLAPGSGPALGPVPVTLTIQDAAGVTYSISLGNLPTDGRSHLLVATVTTPGQASYPLRVLAITAGYTVPPQPRRGGAKAAAARAVALTISGLSTSPAISGPLGAAVPATSAIGSWRAGVTVPFTTPGAPGTEPQLIPSSPDEVRFDPGFGLDEQAPTVAGQPLAPVQGVISLTAPVPARIIAGVATSAFLRANHLKVGSLIQVTAGDLKTPVSVRIAAVVTAFPTITTSGGGLLVDLAAAQDVVAAQGQPPLPVTQWWLATRTGAVPPGLPAGTTVTVRERLARTLLSDPMAVIPQQAVQATALAAALLAILGFSVSVAGSVRERRSQAALLAALGVAGRAQARLLSLEALTLTLPAAATGLLLGTVLAYLLVPAVTLTATAAAPVIPVLIKVPLLAAVAIALAVTAIPVLAAAATSIYRPDPAATLRASEAA